MFLVEKWSRDICSRQAYWVALDGFFQRFQMVRHNIREMLGTMSSLIVQTDSNNIVPSVEQSWPVGDRQAAYQQQQNPVFSSQFCFPDLFMVVMAYPYYLHQDLPTGFAFSLSWFDNKLSIRYIMNLSSANYPYIWGFQQGAYFLCSCAKLY